MKTKEKIANGVLCASLVGFLGGFGTMFYSISKPIPIENELVARMNQIESELESFTGMSMYENPETKDPETKDHYLALAGEYETFMSKPLAVEEKIEYESKLEDHRELQSYGLYGMFLAFGMIMPYIVGLTMREKPLTLDSFKRTKKKS